MYRNLAQTEAAWADWHLYYGDERCLPPQHPERNSRMAELAWLQRVPLVPRQIHPIPAELGPIPAAAVYREVVARVPEFDLVLLGMGEDGHTASLFPGQIHAPAESVHAVFDAPKPPPQRVSLSRQRLSASRQVLILVTGDSKRPALRAWLEGAALPVASVSPRLDLRVLLDAAAAGELREDQ